MKSFFKKLSLVLAAAMVITMLPAQSAKAATTIFVGANETDARAKKVVEIEVGQQQKLGFWGVANYNVAGAATKKWTSNNTKVATVKDAMVTGVAAGTAQISISLTNNQIDYAGSVTVQVKAKAGSQTSGNISVKQTTYKAVEVKFATEEEAKAAKKDIVVDRVKTSSKGTFYLNVPGAKVEQNKNVCTISPLSDGVTYRITVPGAKAPFEVTMHVGAPDFVDISYDTVYMSSETKTDITGKSLSNPLVTPEVKVFDANGIEVQTEAKGFKFTTDKAANIGNPVFNTTKGTIRFNKLESSCYVKVVYSYKDANGKTVSLDPAETTVSPVSYVAPNLQGFVEKICLVAKNTKPEEIAYPTDYTYTDEIAVDQELALAFYFETPDGDKYVPELVKKTVYNEGKTKDMAVAKVNGIAYNYYVVKDDPDATNISLKTNSDGTVYVRGWNEGKETICVYQRSVAGKEDPVNDKLVGILTIEVQEEAKVVAFNFDETSLNGFINTQIEEDQKGIIKYTLEDQYGKEINALVEVTATDNKPLAGISFKDNGKAKGQIIVDYATFGKSVEGRELKVSIKNQKDEFADYITVATDEINTAGRLGYQLVVKSKTVKNADFIDATALATGLQLSIDVARTYDDNKYDLAGEFRVIGDADTTSAKPVFSNVLVVVITDEEGNTVTKNINGNSFELASTLGATTTVVAAADYKLDLFKNGADKVASDTLFTGNYTISLYQTGEVGKAGALELLDAVDVTITDGIEKLQRTNNTYVLERKADDDSLKVTETPAWNTTSSNTGATLVSEIIGELYTWLDKDSDGKVDAGEVGQIKNLFGPKAGRAEVVEAKFVEGADSKKEIFIKHVTVRFKVDSATDSPVIEQTIEINRKFTY